MADRSKMKSHRWSDFDSLEIPMRAGFSAKTNQRGGRVIIGNFWDEVAGTRYMLVELEKFTGYVEIIGVSLINVVVVATWKKPISRNGCLVRFIWSIRMFVFHVCTVCFLRGFFRTRILPV